MDLGDASDQVKNYFDKQNPEGSNGLVAVIFVLLLVLEIPILAVMAIYTFTHPEDMNKKNISHSYSHFSIRQK